MAQLDHFIVPSRDRFAGAQLLAELFDVRWEESFGEFVAVYLNDSLTIDFADDEDFDSHHYCFSVSDEEFDAIFERIKARGIPYRSGPFGPFDMRVNTRGGGKNIYWTEPDGHNWEMLTVSYAR